jgi:hypothetical protein
MAEFKIEFAPLDVKQKDDYVELSQKILAIEAELVKVSEIRANAEAAWRKRENFLNTEKGKLQILIRDIRLATVTEVDV